MTNSPLRTGEWARLEGGVVSCGVSKHAEILQTECVYVELPVLGSEFQAGESYGVIETLHGVTDIYAPVSGTVIAVNSLLESSPNIINEDPYGRGWIIQLKPNDYSELARLMDAEAYISWLSLVEASREKWETSVSHSPEDMIGMITGGHRIVSIEAIGAENVVFNLQNMETGEVDKVLAVARSSFDSWL